MTRRDLMRYFGVGTVVAPVVGGEVISAAQGKLLEVPKVEVVDPSQMFDLVETTALDSAYRTYKPIPHVYPGTKVTVTVNGIKFPGEVRSMTPYALRDGVSGVNLDILL